MLAAARAGRDMAREGQRGSAERKAETRKWKHECTEDKKASAPERKEGRMSAGEESYKAEVLEGRADFRGRA